MSKTASRLRSLYFSIFSHKSLARYNDFILSCAIKARGYNNHDNIYLSGEQYFVTQVLNKIKPEVCIDIGANIGKYSQLLLENTNAKVYAFEPLYDPYKKLLKLKTKFDDRLITVNMGVSDRNETKEIWFSEDNTEYASFSKEINNIPYVNNNKKQAIETTTLDRFFIENKNHGSIDFIKIDTEGFEYEVLIGASKLIHKLKPKMIQIECNWHQLFRAQSLYSLSMLLENYSPFQLLPSRLERRDPTDPFSNIYYFSNFVFIRNDISESMV